MSSISPYPLLAEPDLDNHLGYILAEEAALKKYLTGIKVPNVPADPLKPKIDVGVWYRFPEGERQIRYPFIVIDMIAAEPAYDLFHSLHWEPATKIYRPSFSPNMPEPPLGWNIQTWMVPNFLPMRLTFQVSHFARSNLHDRYLTSIFATDVLPPRPFFIRCEADGIDKRVDVVSFNAANVPETTESGTKRIFRKYYTITMLTEIPQSRLGNPDDATWRTLRVLIPVVAREQFDTYAQQFLGTSDPFNEHSQEEREAGGELFHIAHEGRDIPSAT